MPVLCAVCCAAVMGADDGAMRAVCRRQPALLSLSPDSMARKLQMWAQVLRLPQADVATAVMVRPTQACLAV